MRDDYTLGHRVLDYVLLFLFLAGISLLIIILAFAGQRAFAKWKPEYANSPQHIRDWYSSAELTPEAQLRFKFKSCCAHADVVRTKFKVDDASGEDRWYWLNPATNEWQIIPTDIIHTERRSPDGRPTLFVIIGDPVCFFLPEGGI